MIKIKKNGLEIECDVEDAKALFPEFFDGRKDRTTDEEREETNKRSFMTLESVEAHMRAIKGVKNQRVSQSLFLPKANKSWSATEDAYLSKHKDEDRQAIANVLGRTISGVRNRLQKIGLTPKRRKEKNYEKSWNEEENDYLLKEYSSRKDAARIAKALGRTEIAVYVRAKKMGIAKKRKNTVVVVQKEKDEPKKEDGRMKRMRFIHSRAKGLVKAYGYSYEKARSKAASEWNDAKERQQEKKFFPVFETLENGHSEQIKPVLHHIISNKGCLELDEMEKICNPATGYWNNTSWGAFLEEFMLKSKEVCFYFGVRNRFSIKKEGATMLCYGE